MKALFTLFVVLFALSAINRVEAQTIKLDSLWGKSVERIYAICFTPDSKYLLIAYDKYRITVFDANTGEELRTFTTRYGCFEMKFSKDGTKLYSMSSGGVDILNAKTFESIDTVSFTFKGEEGARRYDVSEDGSKFVIETGYEGINTDYYRYKVISYPDKKVVWQTDVIRWQNNYRYADGKVTFTEDGNYVIGLNQNRLYKWDCRYSFDNGSALMYQLPNIELISYSPDKNYFVLQSNFLHSIPERRLLNPFIIGFTDGAYSEYYTANAFTSNNLWFTTNYGTPFVVNLHYNNVNFKSSLKSVRHIALDKTESLVAFQYYDNGITVYKCDLTVGVIDNLKNITSKIDFQVESSSEDINNTVISLFTENESLPVTVDLYNTRGEKIETLYSGILPTGRCSLPINTLELSNGVYYVHIITPNESVTKPFVKFD